MACSGEDTTTGRTEMIFDNPEHMHGTMHITTTQGDAKKPLIINRKWEGQHQLQLWQCDTGFAENAAVKLT